MVKGARSSGKASKGGPRRPVKAAPSKAKKPAAPKVKKPAPVEEPVEITEPFVLGVVPGATVGGWVDAWKQRMPHSDIDLRQIAFAAQHDALTNGGLDAALVRLPIDGDALHVIPLYDEVVVAVVSADSHLTAADELDLADLTGEVIIVPRDDVLSLDVPGGVAPSFAAPDDTEQAIATVAAGVGVVLVPMALARLYQRKDAAYRPLRDAPRSTVALAWPLDATTPVVEAFIGIVRGRTANSSRG